MLRKNEAKEEKWINVAGVHAKNKEGGKERRSEREVPPLPKE